MIYNKSYNKTLKTVIIKIKDTALPVNFVNFDDPETHD